MPQDTDVARMAAALRTPSLKYRSFGNEPVRLVPAPPPDDEQAFSILGDALAGVEDLRPDAVLSERSAARDRHDHPAYAEPVAEPRPAYPLARDAYQPTRQEAPVPQEAPMEHSAAPGDWPPPPRVDTRESAFSAAPARSPAAVPPAAPAPVAPAPDAVVRPTPMASVPIPAASISAASVPAVLATDQPAPFPARPPAVRPDLNGSSLLQVLLGAAPAAVPAASPPKAVQGTAPIVSDSTRVGIGAPPAWSSTRYGSGTGSSLLDTLFGADGTSAGVHYPLLDALGAAMQGSPADPSPRHWPAARVDVALPELLRRVAAGFRVARSAA